MVEQKKTFSTLQAYNSSLIESNSASYYDDVVDKSEFKKGNDHSTEVDFGPETKPDD